MIMGDFHLKDKCILVTGATSGIGFQTARHIIQAGGRVIISGRNLEKLTQVKQELDKGVDDVIHCDMNVEGEIKALAHAIKNVDGVVHCSGMVKPYPIRFLSFDKIDETMRLNFYSAVALIAQLDQHRKLNKNGSIVFISSISAQHPHKGGTAYAASKAALESYSKVVAMEYAHKKIRCNVVSPGMVKTPLYDKASADASHEAMQAHIDKYPLGMGEPKDVANAIVYLLSDASRWVTGTNIVMEGGILLGY